MPEDRPASGIPPGTAPGTRIMCGLIRKAMSEFYRDPENVRRFEDWKSSRRKGGASQPASIARAL